MESLNKKIQKAEFELSNLADNLSFHISSDTQAHEILSDIYHDYIEARKLYLEQLQFIKNHYYPIMRSSNFI